MANDILYDLTSWEDAPSTLTPINAENLNARDRLLKKVVDKTNELSGQIEDLEVGVDKETITEAVNNYLDENSVPTGATQEQASQIEKNKNDITNLTKQNDEHLEMSVKHFSDIEVSCGDNLMASNPAITLGSGWSGSLANGLTHSSGTETVEIDVKTNVDDYLLVSFTLSAYSISQLCISVGDLPLVDTYFGKNDVKLILKSDGGKLKFTPSNSFGVTISNLVVRKVFFDGSGNHIETFKTDTIAHRNGDVKIGLWNVLLGGEDSVVDNISATRIIAIGTKAMESIQYGTRSIAIGQYALRAIVNSERNIAIGADSMYRTTGGEDNIAIGMASLDGANTNVNRNVAIGGHAMTGSTPTAEENVALGHYAGRYAGNRNTYVGMRSGYFMEGNGNVAIGSYTMQGTKKHSGNYNTAIGTQAQNNDSNISYSTAIGYQAKCDKSNQVVIGRDEVVETKLFGDLIIKGTDGVIRQIVFNADGSCSWEALNITAETYVLTADDFTVGGVNSDGTESANTTTRMYTDVLELPSNGHVSVDCKSGGNWIVYFFNYNSGESSSFLGKSSFTNQSIDDIKKVTLASGTMSGATHFRISLKDDSSGSLTYKKEEMVGYVTVTIVNNTIN